MANDFGRSARRVYPCTQNCPERYPACQDHCKRFLEVKAAISERQEAERKRSINYYTTEKILERRDRQAKKNKNRPKRYYH